MSPYCNQMGHSETTGSTLVATGVETAAPDTGTPTPTPPSSVTPSPPPPQEENDDDEDEDYQRFAAMNPPPMLQNGSPDCLPIDHNLPHLLKQVSGNTDLSSVRDIRLRVISRDMSLQRLALFIPNLRELNLDGSCLGSLRDLGCGLMSLHVLRVARCGLESLDGTFGITSLRELYASNNRVDDVGPCSCLPHIRVIDLRKNVVEDISFLEFLNVCPHLEDLSLADCPAASRPGYRNRVCKLLPNLASLDGVPTSESRGDGDIDNYYSGNETINARMEEEMSDEGASNSRQRSNVDHSPQSPESPTNHGDGSNEGSFESVRSDASSSCYQADLSHDYCKVNSAQESNSVPALPKLDQKRKLETRIRPATTGAVPSGTIKRGPLRTSTPTKHRPATASVRSEKGEPNTSSSGVTDHRRDSPSTLTSGRVVCGNLTMALRNRRRRQDAWTEDTLNNHEEEAKGVKNDSIPEENVEENVSAESVPSDTTDVLEESRKWRELYTSYRSQNRLRWEKEKDELMKVIDGKDAEAATSVVPDNDEAARRIREEKLNRNETKSKKVAENKKTADAIKMFQSRNTCCPQLFSRQNQTHDSSYDADTSSGLDLSPEGAKKTSGPKKAPYTRRR